MIPKESFRFNILNTTFLKAHINDIKTAYSEYCKNINMKSVECNYCHRKNCHKHGYYDRYYLISPDDLISEDNTITILRIKCNDCGHTHAILPEEIIPYQQYSLIFVYTALEMHYVRNISIREVCQRMNINQRTFFKWAKTFMEQLKKHLGVINTLNFSIKSFLIKLKNISSYVKDFGSYFLKKTDRIFMQVHKNPPNYHIPRYMLLFE